MLRRRKNSCRGFEAGTCIECLGIGGIFEEIERGVGYVRRKEIGG